ncbi:putative periplasmic lipoprotein [Chitinophaga silvatica]|nr:hypothetical protein [Chitinophaga silvatica]
MKKSLIIIGVVLTGCSTVPTNTQVKDSVSVVQNPAVTDSVATPEEDIRTYVSDTITGDFNGDGKIDSAWMKLTKQGYGNPVEDGVPDEYTVFFSDTSLSGIKIGCCEAILINEGDLNKDGKDELSTYQASENGNTYRMSTWTFGTGNWQPLFKTFLIPTGGDYIPLSEIEKRVFMRNDSLFYLDFDPNDEGFRTVEVPINLNSN